MLLLSRTSLGDTSELPDVAVTSTTPPECSLAGSLASLSQSGRLQIHAPLKVGSGGARPLRALMVDGSVLGSSWGSACLQSSGQRLVRRSEPWTPTRRAAPPRSLPGSGPPRPLPAISRPRESARPAGLPQRAAASRQRELGSRRHRVRTQRVLHETWPKERES